MGGGGGTAFVASLRRSAMDHASPSRRWGREAMSVNAYQVIFLGDYVSVCTRGEV